jgi:hypothetical protein
MLAVHLDVDAVQLHKADEFGVKSQATVVKPGVLPCNNTGPVMKPGFAEILDFQQVKAKPDQGKRQEAEEKPPHPEREDSEDNSAEVCLNVERLKHDMVEKIS